MKGSPQVTRVGDEVVVSLTGDLDFPTLFSTLERMLAGDPTLRDCPALVLDTGRLQLTADQVMTIEGLVSRYGGGTRLLHVITEQVDEMRSRGPGRGPSDGLGWLAGAGWSGPEPSPDPAPPSRLAPSRGTERGAPVAAESPAGGTGGATEARRRRREGARGGEAGHGRRPPVEPAPPRGKWDVDRRDDAHGSAVPAVPAAGAPAPYSRAGGVPEAGPGSRGDGRSLPAGERGGGGHPGAAGSSRVTGLGRPGVVVRRTLRSGHRLVYDGDVVILGDVNPGAEILAAGDVVVFGRLRGTVHAGFKGEEQAVVAALVMEPVQLRIARWIGRAPDGEPPPLAAGRGGATAGRGPEIACVRDGQVLIEPFDPARWFWQRQRDLWQRPLDRRSAGAAPNR